MLDVTEESCIIEKRERESTDKIGILGGRWQIPVKSISG
jgi:hypothetical protein